jgi:hypothetical protein
MLSADTRFPRPSGVRAKNRVICSGDYLIFGWSAPCPQLDRRRALVPQSRLIVRPSRLIAPVGIAVVVRLAAEGLKRLTDRVGDLFFDSPARRLSAMTIRSSSIADGCCLGAGGPAPHCSAGRSTRRGGKIPVPKPYSVRSRWHPPRAGDATIGVGGVRTLLIRWPHG